MLDNKYKCNKCKGLCEELSKPTHKTQTCTLRGANFVLAVSSQIYSYILLNYDYENKQSISKAKFSTIEEAVNFLLSWKELQLEDAIRLAKVDRNV